MAGFAIMAPGYPLPFPPTCFFYAKHLLFCRDYTHYITDYLQIFVIERKQSLFKNDFYAKIKITGTNDD